MRNALPRELHNEGAASARMHLRKQGGD